MTNSKFGIYLSDKFLSGIIISEQNQKLRKMVKKKKFSDLALKIFKEHYDFLHEKELHMWKCEQCDNKYESREELEIHKLKHIENLRNICNECGKEFESTEELFGGGGKIFFLLKFNRHSFVILMKRGPKAPRTARRAVGGPKGPPALRRS